MKLSKGEKRLTGDEWDVVASFVGKNVLGGMKSQCEEEE